MTATALDGLPPSSPVARVGGSGRLCYFVRMTSEATADSAARLERDALGELAIPAGAWWGIHTQRAIANFPVSGRRVHPRLIRALALVKKACALTNAELGFLAHPLAEAIAAACDEIAVGRRADAFPVDALQGGAGTSTNMNMNEALANLALERLGHARGAYDVIHPIEHVNLHQSTNDTFPTAVRIAAIEAVRALSEDFASLQGAFQDRERAFAGVIAMGRTEWQDAVPVALGAEFGAFGEAFARDRWRTFKCEERLRVINLGGTAVGTGLAAPRRYIFRVQEQLRVLTGMGLTRAENGLDATSNADALVETAGVLGAAAANLSKAARDLRIRHYLGEIRLPARQTGSSIMPGKVNPVIPEAVIGAALRASALGALVGVYAGQGTERINEFMPALADALLEMTDLLGAAARILTGHVREIEADAGVCRRRVCDSPALIAAFVPTLGYRRAEELALAFRASGERDFRAFLIRALGETAVEEALSPNRLMALGSRS